MGYVERISKVGCAKFVWQVFQPLADKGKLMEHHAFPQADGLAHPKGRNEGKKEEMTEEIPSPPDWRRGGESEQRNKPKYHNNMTHEKFIEAFQVTEELSKVGNELQLWEDLLKNDGRYGGLTFDSLFRYFGRDDKDIDDSHKPMKQTIIRIIKENAGFIVDDLKKQFAELEKQFDEL